MSLLSCPPSKKLSPTRPSFPDLPSELRIRIYHTLLLIPGLLISPRLKTTPATSAVLHALKPPHHRAKPSASALKVYSICRQITAEALHEFYSQNTFCAANGCISIRYRMITGAGDPHEDGVIYTLNPQKPLRAVEPEYVHLVRELGYVIPPVACLRNRAVMDFVRPVQEAFPALRKVVFFIRTNFDATDLAEEIGHPWFDWEFLQGDLDGEVMDRIQEDVTVLVKEKLDRAFFWGG